MASGQARPSSASHHRTSGTRQMESSLPAEGAPHTAKWETLFGTTALVHADVLHSKTDETPGDDLVGAGYFHTCMANGTGGVADQKTTSRGISCIGYVQPRNIDTSAIHPERTKMHTHKRPARPQVAGVWPRRAASHSRCHANHCRCQPLTLENIPLVR